LIGLTVKKNRRKKERKMRNQRIARDMAERPDTVGTFALAPVKFHASSVHPKNYQPTYGSAGIPLEWDNVAELKIHLDGLPIQIRFSLDEASTKTLLGAIATDTSHSLLRSALGKIADQIRGSTTRRIGPSSGPTLTDATMSPEAETAAAPSDAQTVLRVGPLELNLLDRTAKRGDRNIDLRPREFRLLRYMMERSDKLLTRAKLLQEVWNYKFVPQTNLVDVHMGRLRRKVDGPNEPAMIRSVRGAGFVLNANPLSQN
jgi:two-component system, OmpR family, response regulator